MKKKWLSGMLAFMLVGTTVMPMASVHAAETQGKGTTYYVSSRNGSDSNNGTSKNTAFQSLSKINDLKLGPGDQVLLERGSVFENQALHFTDDSGSADAPIKVAAYGDEKADRPKINTNGKGIWDLNYGKHLDNPNHKWKGEVSSSILLKDAEYIEIKGLEITNDHESEEDRQAYNDPRRMDRTGVAGVAKDKGTVDHIVLDDLYIHNVAGNIYNKHMTNGGIYFIVEQPTDPNTAEIARYNDVQIKNCSIDTVDRWGIAVGYTYQWDKFGGAELSDAVMEKYASSKVVIENNYLNNVGGDAITTMYLDRPVVQYNVSENSSKHINQKDYSKEQDQLDPETGEPTGKKLGVTTGRVAAGIWPWKCKNAVFQYNECFNTLNAANGNGDGQPWDADSGDGTNYQYNYSHGNTASTIMFCAGESINNTFRYNISQNEDMGPLDPAGNNKNTHVYNNTFYIKEGINSIWSSMHNNDGPVNMENNIFYFAGKTPQKVNWQPRNNNKVYDNNLYYNVEEAPKEDQNAVVVKAGEKEVLKNAGDGPTGPAKDHQARKHEDPNVKTEFDGYKLAEGSPAMNAGKVVKDMNGYSVDQDFFGHKITATPEIGAAESDAVSELVLRSDKYTIDQGKKTISDLPKNTTVETFRKNVIYDPGVTVTVESNAKAVLEDSDIVKGGATVTLSYEGLDSVTYTVVASSDKELKSTSYELQDKTIYVPYTNHNPTTVSQMKKAVVISETAEASVVNGGNTLKNTDPVADGMKFVITAEDGSVNEYTIKQKNEYNWTTDYGVFGPHGKLGKKGQQGNIWFAQQNAGGSGWADVSSKDNEWPNWTIGGTWPIGVDNGSAANNQITKDMHGLIGSPVNTDAAMSFRAPKSGYVSFDFKNGDQETQKEPYFRQANNQNGDRTVVLKVKVNDQELNTITLTGNEQYAPADKNWTKSTDVFNRIKVQAGDSIRVTTTSTGNTDKNTIHITPDITYLDEKIEDTEAPDAPANVRVADVSQTSAKVAWDEALDNVGTVKYNVYLDGTLAQTAEGTSCELTGLTENKTYKVTVKAIDAAGNESKEGSAEFTTKKAVNKDALKKNIDKAKDLLGKTDKYTEESLKALKSVYEEALKVYEDKSAAQNVVDEANRALELAIDSLEEKTPGGGDGQDGDNQGGNNQNGGGQGGDDQNGNNQNGHSQSGSQNAGGQADGSETPKTGDTANAGAWGACALAALTAGTVVLRKRRR